METYLIDRDSFSIPAILDAVEKGRLPLCPICRSPILIARTPDEARARGIPPGMQCSTTPAHFQVDFKLARRKPV